MNECMLNLLNTFFFVSVEMVMCFSFSCVNMVNNTDQFWILDRFCILRYIPLGYKANALFLLYIL